MKLIVSGGAGFIGTNFVIHALDLGHTVLCLDKFIYQNRAFHDTLIAKYPNYSYENRDICDTGYLSDLIIDFRPDSFVHFAAETHVDHSILDPTAFIKTNIMGTKSVLDACSAYVKNSAGDNFKLVHISTDEVFGQLDDTGYFTETSPYDPTSPYSASKASSDLLVKAWMKTFSFPAVITNCSNNFGPFQFADKLIPLSIKNILHGERVPIYGNGQQIRDWLFVGDHVDAILHLLRADCVGESFVIGGQNELRNIDLIKLILDEMGSQGVNVLSLQETVEFVGDRPAHDYRYAIDCSKITNTVGWRPKVSLSEGLKRTIKWYIEHPEHLKLKQSQTTI